jgi:hypothetical protein
LKNLEALSGGAKRKFAFKYGLKQWIVNNHESKSSKEEETKATKACEDPDSH